MSIKILVFLSFITLVALLTTQGYLVYNTYVLKKNTNLSETRLFVAGFYSSEVSSQYFNQYRNTLDLLVREYQHGEITKTSLLDTFKSKMKVLNNDFLPYYEKEVEKKLDYAVSLVINAETLVYFDTTSIDLIFEAKESDELKLLGNDVPFDNRILINTSTWENPLKYDGSTYPYFELVTSVFFSEEQSNLSVLKKILNVLLTSLLIFCFVLGLLYYSIQNLIKQKRISEIKTDFINNITHEFKTPLATLAIATKTLKRIEIQKNPEVFLKTINIVNRQNTRLQKLLDQIITQSLGYQQINLVREKVAINSFLDNLINDFTLSVKELGIEVRTDLPAEEEFFFIDKFYFSTALLNILGNAVKYEGTQIVVAYSLDKKNKNVYIKISDNGLGISKEHHNLIFNKFYRVSEKDTHNYKGLGLGLYYSNEVIKSHGGQLTVSSELHKGSTFISIIPTL